MKIVLGVGGEQNSESDSSAAALLRRLRFPRAAIDVVHMLSPHGFDDWGLDVVLTGEVYDAANQALRDWAQTLVERTAAQLRKDRPALPEDSDPAPVRSIVKDALLVAEGLLSYADHCHADLIAIDGPRSGPIHELLTGSVARSLTIGSHERSLLLAKRPSSAAIAPLTTAPEPSTAANHIPVRAVFATDHSPYADRCLQRLLEFAPVGISHLTVLTVYPEDELNDVARFLPDLAVHPAFAVRKLLTSRNESVLRELAPLLAAAGAVVESRVIGGEINEAIVSTMTETRADLLILGAHGHGFVERLLLGSVSFHQAMTGTHSMLILRA